MKAIIFGAAGNSGRRLAVESVAQGHEVSLAARNLSKMASCYTPEFLEQVTTHELDSLDAAAVGQVMQGHEVAVNAAGDPLTMGDAFGELCDIFITQADRHLTGVRRVWLFGGLALLTIPHANVMGLELPRVPEPYKYHWVNYNRIRHSTLDWSMMCPGPMVAAQDDRVRDDLRISVDIVPYEVNKFTRFLPKIALSVLMMKRLPELTVTYEDVARIMVNHFEANGDFSHRRVGVALPKGETAKKENWKPGIKA
ncbi:MAG: NAD(P)H-binding protein [Chloroflexi bacterium]|nr:NAD(P)H-binding protein [Chloroflexota bacterium]